MSISIGTTTSILASSILNLRPTSDEEWIINNIYIPLGSVVEIYRWNDTGTTPQILITKTSVSLLSVAFHSTLSDYIVIKNISGTTIYVSYDGVIIS